jgi:PAS domain S-box-containing protein
VSEFAYVAPIGGIALVAFLVLHRLGGSAAPLWAWAWVALYSVGLVAALPSPAPWLRAGSAFVGAQFAVLLLAGALQNAGRLRPRWLFPAGVAIGIARALASVASGDPLSFSIDILWEPPLIAAAAWVSWRAGRAEGAVADRFLAAALLGAAMVCACDAFFRIRGGPAEVLVPAWVGIALLCAGLQATSVIERARARERRLQREHARLTQLIERTSDTVALCDASGRLAYMNDAGRRMFGISPELPVEDVNLSQLQAASDSESDLGELRQALARDGIASRDTSLRRLDGTPLEVSEVILAERDAAGHTTGFGVLIRDESTRASAEHEANQRARDLDLLRRIAEAGLSGEPLGGVVERILGDVRDSLGIDAGGVYLLDAGGSDLVLAGAVGIENVEQAALARFPAVLPILRAALDAGQPLFLEEGAAHPLIQSEAVRALGMGILAAAPLRADGRLLGIAFFGRRARLAWSEAERRLLGVIAGQIAQAVGHARGVEERLAQAELLEAERRTLRAVLEATPLGVMVADDRDRIVMMNRTAAAHFGLGAPERWIGAAAHQLAGAVRQRLRPSGAEIARFERASQDPDHELGEALVATEDNGVRRLEIFSSTVRTERGELFGRVRISRDVTEERRLEDELRQAQKMETVGRFAGGVAHDFNNQLTAILGNAKLLEEASAGDTHVQAALGDLVGAAEHCARLTHGLLSFARRSPVAPRPLSPGRALREVESTLRAVLPSSIALVVEIAPSLPPVLADPTQLQQVLFNLALNARDAIRGPGRILLTALCDAGAARRPGDWVSFVVEDTGVGMEPELQSRIFEPFFTTKQVGEGTGLGLAIAYGVVESHGGWIDVESEPGRGSRFCVALPVASAEAQAAEGVRHPAELPRGSETLLVADDEPTVLRLARSWLGKLGYRVIEARDGDEAVALHAQYAGAIDLALLDVTMPKRSGNDALSAMRAREPGLRAILASGNFDAADAAEGAHAAKVLPKPYSRETLARLVRAVLDRAAA